MPDPSHKSYKVMVEEFLAHRKAVGLPPLGFIHVIRSKRLSKDQAVVIPHGVHYGNHEHRVPAQVKEWVKKEAARG